MGKRRIIMLVRCVVIFTILCITLLFCTTTVAESLFGKRSGDLPSCDKEGCTNVKGKNKPTTEQQGAKNVNPVGEAPPTEVDVMMTFVNAENNRNLQGQFKKTTYSILQHASVPIAFHIIGEPASQTLAKEIIETNNKDFQRPIKMAPLDIEELKEKLQDSVKPMQKHFSFKPGAYYNHELFFLSIMLHRLLPETMKRIIMLDADLKFRTDIKELYGRFSLFNQSNILGIGRDLQPVYRHALWQYRNENPGTRVGEPPPDGLTGFNSGVLLLDLDRMRQSQLYNELIKGEKVTNLTQKYHFKGHLGDQDFFTMISFEHEELFHVLPCHWNRQLCQWWRDKGYQAIFDKYYKCEGDIKVYHGNCNTPIPDD